MSDNEDDNFEIYGTLLEPFDEGKLNLIFLTQFKASRICLN